MFYHCILLEIKGKISGVGGDRPYEGEYGNDIFPDMCLEISTENQIN